MRRCLERELKDADLRSTGRNGARSKLDLTCFRFSHGSRLQPRWANQDTKLIGMGGRVRPVPGGLAASLHALAAVPCRKAFLAERETDLCRIASGHCSHGAGSCAEQGLFVRNRAKLFQRRGLMKQVTEVGAFCWTAELVWLFWTGSIVNL